MAAGPRAGEVGSDRPGEVPLESRGCEREPPPLVRVASGSRRWLERHAWQGCVRPYSTVYGSRLTRVYSVRMSRGRGWIRCPTLSWSPTLLPTLLTCVKGGAICTEGGAICTEGGAICTEGGAICTEGGAICTEGGAICTERGTPQASPPALLLLLLLSAEVVLS